MCFTAERDVLVVGDLSLDAPPLWSEPLRRPDAAPPPGQVIPLDFVLVLHLQPRDPETREGCFFSGLGSGLWLFRTQMGRTCAGGSGRPPSSTRLPRCVSSSGSSAILSDTVSLSACGLARRLWPRKPLPWPPTPATRPPSRTRPPRGVSPPPRSICLSSKREFEETLKERVGELALAPPTCVTRVLHQPTAIFDRRGAATESRSDRRPVVPVFLPQPETQKTCSNQLKQAENWD